MTTKIGFIGAGRMAGTMIAGLIRQMTYSPDEIVACAPSSSTRKKITEQTGIRMFKSASEIAGMTDTLVLAVGPKTVPDLFEKEELRLGGRHLLISIVAGVSIETLKSYVPDTRIIRVMPNHCCMVLEGASGYTVDNRCTDKDRKTAENIFKSLGRAVEVKETDMGAVTGVSGSSPAFMYMFLRALIDGAVLRGLPRGTATELAAQTMVGAGKMVLESGMSVDNLIDSVCSPGGATAEGVKVLEEKDMESILVDAVNATVKKAENKK